MKQRYSKLLCLLLSVVLSVSMGSFRVDAEEEGTTQPVTPVTTTTTQPAREPSTSAQSVPSVTVQEEETTKSKKQARREAKQTLKQQRASLEQKRKENERLLAEFSDSAKITEAYIDALDEKIGYMNEELVLLDEEVAAAEKKADAIAKQIAPLKKELKSLQKQLKKAQEQYDALSRDFQSTYDAYCLRLKAMYISGSTGVLEALLMSDDLGQFLNRFEMIKAVARSDTALLKEVNRQMQALVTEQDGLNDKKAAIHTKKKSLDVKQEALDKEKETVLQKQAEIAEKKVILAQDRAESDRLFAEYAQKAQIYTEFRNEDETLIAQVNSEIDALLKGLKEPEEVTTAKNPHQNPNDVTGNYAGDGELFSRSNAALSLSYPVPGHYGVSQAFGHMRNGKAHTGIDFPCPTGSKIVAAQKGIVVTVKRLNYSYGYYVMVYHGTDAKGRKVVTLYAHNSSILVSVGQSVRKGQQIAKAGSTGNSTGPHCHFELILDGSKVNPRHYLG